MDATGYRCEHCALIFAADEADVIEGTELRDSMYGRAPTLEPVEWSACPYCASAELEPIYLCSECRTREALDGADHCARCLRDDEQPQGESACHPQN